MNYKIIFLDLDGTLLNSQKTISPQVLNALNVIRENGAHVVLSSGRADTGMRDVMEMLNMDKQGGYIISYNGGKVIDLNNDKVIFSKTMDKELIKEVFALARESGLEPLIYGKDIIYSENPDDFYVKHEGVITSLPIEKFDGDIDAVTFPIHKCLAVGEAEKVSNALTTFNKHFGDRASVCKSCPIFLEVMPKGINKGMGVAAVLKELNIPKSMACACGDEFNDIEMLQTVGMSFAMDNAAKEVKGIATHVVPSNDEHGVAYAVATCFEECYSIDF